MPNPRLCQQQAPRNKSAKNESLQNIWAESKKSTVQFKIEVRANAARQEKGGIVHSYTEIIIVDEHRSTNLDGFGVAKLLMHAHHTNYQIKRIPRFSHRPQLLCDTKKLGVLRLH